MKKKFAVAAATAALITASFAMNVFAADLTVADPASATDEQKENVYIAKDPTGDRFFNTGDDTVCDAGFIKYDGKVYYVDANGVFKEVTTGIYGDYYLKDGKKVTASTTVTIDGKTYLVDGNTSKIKKADPNKATIEKGFKSGKVTDDYLIDENGAVIKGWKEINGEWYYAKPDGETVEDAWVMTTPGRWYFIGKDGLMVTAENADESNSAADDTKNNVSKSTDGGKTATIEQDSNTYVVDKNGLWLNGWVYDNGWFFYTNKAAATWATYGKNWVYVGADFKAAQNEVKSINGRNYAFGKDCYMITGLGKCVGKDTNTKKIEGTVYADANGVLKTGYQTIDGAKYWFPTAASTTEALAVATAGIHNDGNDDILTDATGKLVINNWLKVGNDWYYGDKDGKVVKSAERTVAGSKYYFKNTGVMEASDVFTVGVAGSVVTLTSTADGSLLTASSTGKATALVNSVVIDKTGRRIDNGWAQLNDGKWAYAKDGKAYDGWLLYNGSWYYIDYGHMLTDAYVGQYYLDSNGVWVSTGK